MDCGLKEHFLSLTGNDNTLGDFLSRSK